MNKNEHIDGVSVIICCYNSMDRLPKTLKYIASQNVRSDFRWEIIVVDNGSSDDTKKVAFETWEIYGKDCIGEFKIIEEVKPGLVEARKKGCFFSRFDFILFVDDDNWLDENYLLIGLDILSSKNNLGVLGGKGRPAFENQKPEWFDDYAAYYAVGKQFKNSGNLSQTKGWVYGASSFYRSSALKEIFLDEASIVTKSTRIVRGDDIELCFRMLLKNYEIWYDENLVFEHFIPKGRSTKLYIRNLLKTIYKDSYKLDGLCYKCGAQKENKWFSTPLKRDWKVRFFVDIFRIHYHLKSISFSIYIHYLRLKSLLMQNRNYNKSFNS